MAVRRRGHVDIGSRRRLRIAPAWNEADYAQHAHTAVERNSNYIIRTYNMARRRNADTVQPYATGLDQSGAGGTGADNTRVPQPNIEAMALSAARPLAQGCATRRPRPTSAATLVGLHPGLQRQQLRER